MPADASARALVRYLAERDVACTSCGYNLRGLAGERCPECGDSLEGLKRFAMAQEEWDGLRSAERWTIGRAGPLPPLPPMRAIEVSSARLRSLALLEYATAVGAWLGVLAGGAGAAGAVLLMLGAPLAGWNEICRAAIAAGGAAAAGTLVLVFWRRSNGLDLRAWPRVVRACAAWAWAAAGLIGLYVLR